MSIAVMSKVWETKCGSHASKLVLLAIADHANDKGEAYPSITRIANRSDLSRRAVMNHIANLEKKGFLIASKQPGSFTRYTVQLVNSVHGCTACTGERRSRTGERRSKTGERGAPESLETLESDKRQKQKRFSKPSVEDVTAYGRTLVPPFTRAETFIDFYESKGWRIGKSPMKDWKAAIRTWNRKEPTQKTSSPNEFGF